MRSKLGIFNTNQPALDGTLFSIEGLASYIEQTWSSGLPMFLSHDMHRPIGWSQGIGLLISPELVGVLGGSFMAENDEDQTKVEQAVRVYLSRKYSEVSPEDEGRLRERLGAVLTPEGQILRRESVCAWQKGIAQALFPHLFERQREKDGLTALRDLKELAPGVYEVDGLLVFAHHYFRRSQSRHNNLNADFLGVLHQLSLDDKLNVKIALDPDVVGLPGTWKQFIELQYWWGPKFTSDLPKIENGITRHVANESMRLFHGISRTEFWWHEQNGIKSFEVEEVRDLPSYGISSDQYACRYAHSMIDPNSRVPNHLDGAVRIYDTATLLERIDKDMADAGRHTTYVKLWRIDGQIAVETWKVLLSHFFRDNKLIGEYFGGMDTVRVAESEGLPEQSRKRASYVSRTVDPEDGMLALVTYQTRSEALGQAQVQVEPTEKVGGDDRADYCIELNALDYVKLLRREHKPLGLPSEFRWRAFEDLDINLPLIVHRGDAAEASVAKSINCFRHYCRYLAQSGGERFITAEFGIEVADRLIKYSFAGRVQQLSTALDVVPPIPGDIGGVPAWCSKLHEGLGRIYPESKFYFDHLEMVKAGALKVVRHHAMLEPASDGKLGVLIPQNDGDLRGALQNGTIALAPFFDVQACRCNECSTSYLDCSCTALLDHGSAGSTAEKFDLLGYFWTQRPNPALRTELRESP